ncbi:ATP-dependent DNA helicase [Microbacterium sp. SORGH_AS_0888]|uniref:ATP-dependent helicase n=1 Tax=Microbacterium sp. SORGH_AS_0888 TaxID=3041791 RepID=UPI00278180CC|nr:ATP-dependent DNA helicase [Microbacterium sp. SORGH_AS_0888]MDQ1128198.1 superfamily I DNA/RNA helicase/RecB family exonuclease [Microbacterium sp. SORGH_AS_0888]
MDVAPVALDPEQLAVVALRSCAVVVGGPGSGKTTALRALLRRVVDEHGTDAALVLTPSRPTATALRDDLALELGRATSGPWARSIASFAYALVRAEAVRRGEPVPQLLTGGDEDQLIHDLLRGDAEDEAAGFSRWPERLAAPVRSSPAFRAELRVFLAECTMLGITPAALRRRAEMEDRPAWAALASFAIDYAEVRDRMRGAHRDAAGMLREATGILRDVHAPLPPGLRTVLVDDAQELTAGGVELLGALADRGIDVVAFGDPDIGSGAFRGARPENFAALDARWRTRIVLADGHRGTPFQRDAVRRIVSRIGAVGVVAHRRAPEGVDDDGSLRTFVLRSPAEEIDAIARLLRERHVHDRVPWDSCAVIAHDTRQVAALEAELSARSVPARATGAAQSLGELRPVRDLVRCVLAALDPHADADPAELLAAAGLDPVELRRLRAALRKASPEAGRSSAELLRAAFTEPLTLDLLDTRESRAAARLVQTLRLLREQHAAGATAHELLWTVWERSGREQVWAQAARGTGPVAAQADRDLDAVVALFQAAKRHGEREVDAEPVAFLRAVLDSEVAEDRLEAEAPRPRVRVLTPAAAVGAEFDTVVVAGVQDGLWPNTRVRGGLLETWRLGEGEEPDVADRRRAVLHDELRLFARALSRARSRVFVTAVDDDDTGPSPFLELLPPASAPPSAHPLSLRGLVAAHRRTLTEPRASGPARRHAAGQLALLAAAGVPGAEPSEWYGIAEVTSTAPLHDPAAGAVRVSPSRIHDVEECALNWVIGDLGGDPGGATAGIGTLVHAALETAGGGTEQELWAAVEDRWGEIEFESAWRERAERARARDIVRRLHRYVRDVEASGGRLVGAEPHFEVPIALDRGEALLSGYIDRVELTRDGRVVIVDVKTGRREPQTDAKVADHPQLAAYQLAHARGALPETAGLPAGGAKLVVLQPTSASVSYATPTQPPFDAERTEAFLERVGRAVEVMSGTEFAAPYEEHCRDEFSFGVCRIHTIGPVSAS